jgi:serine/threonine protein kinase
MTDTTPKLSPSANGSSPEIPDFELVREIGQGGFGRVWLARNRTTGCWRAVKVIPKSHVGKADPAGREIASITRFDTGAQREHPNLLTIHHVGQTADHLFYVMDLADDLQGSAAQETTSYQAATLERRLADGPLLPEECLRNTTQLLQGLASLHEAGMIHRDVKPANCLFAGGQLKLADFGLLTEAGPQVSRIGTQKYMPPDGRMGTRADVYAAGLVIYEMLTGLPVDRFPQLGRQADAVAGSLTLASTLRIVLHACQPDPTQRFADAGQMLAELDRLMDEPPLQNRAGRRTFLAVGGAAALGVLAFGIYWWLRPERVHVNFISYPFGATVLLDGREVRGPEGDPLKTPCTVDDLPAKPHDVALRYPGRPDAELGAIDFSKVRQVVGRWDDQSEGSGLP